MLLLLWNAPLRSDPGPCPRPSGFLFDTDSSDGMNGIVWNTIRPLAVAVMWLPCLQPGPGSTHCIAQWLDTVVAM